MLEEKAVEILNQFEVLAKQYTPDVIDAAVSVTRWTGVSSVATGFICLILAVVSFKASFYTFKYCKKKAERDFEWMHGVVASVALGGFLVFIFSIFGIGHILDIWSWIAIFNPKLALAKSIMGM